MSPFGTARATGLLTAVLVRRLLREPMVLRSLAFPVVITAGTLLATLAAATVNRAPPVIAVPVGFSDPTLDAALVPYGLHTVPVADPIATVRTGWARAGTDGVTVYARGPTSEASVVESHLRAQRGSRWQVDADIVRVGVDDEVAKSFGRRVGRLVGAVFALYGVVLGAGMIARDRDDGTLGVEFTLALPRQVPGIARFLAGSAVLALFAVPSIAVFDALIGISDERALYRHAIAASAASVGLGLLGMAQAGTKGGFAGPLGFALVAAFGVFLSGRFVPSLAPLLPIASLTTDGSGWEPLVGSLVVGMIAAWRFAKMVVA